MIWNAIQARIWRYKTLLRFQVHREPPRDDLSEKENGISFNSIQFIKIGNELFERASLVKIFNNFYDV